MEVEKKSKVGTYKPRGERGKGATQVRFHLRLDNDLEPWLNSQVNRNRYVNNLIREDMLKNK